MEGDEQGGVPMCGRSQSNLFSTRWVQQPYALLANAALAGMHARCACMPAVAPIYNRFVYHMLRDDSLMGASTRRKATGLLATRFLNMCQVCI